MLLYTSPDGMSEVRLSLFLPLPPWQLRRGGDELTVPAADGGHILTDEGDGRWGTRIYENVDRWGDAGVTLTDDADIRPDAKLRPLAVTN